MYYNNDSESQLNTFVSLAFLMERNADFHNAHIQKTVWQTYIYMVPIHDYKRCYTYHIGASPPGLLI